MRHLGLLQMVGDIRLNALLTAPNTARNNPFNGLGENCHPDLVAEKRLSHPTRVGFMGPEKREE